MTLGTACALADMESTMKHYDWTKKKLCTKIFSRPIPLVQRALSIGAYVQIDEPLLSTGKVSIELLKKS